MRKSRCAISSAKVEQAQRESTEFTETREQGWLVRSRCPSTSPGDLASAQIGSIPHFKARPLVHAPRLSRRRSSIIDKYGPGPIEVPASLKEGSRRRRQKGARRRHCWRTRDGRAGRRFNVDAHNDQLPAQVRHVDGRGARRAVRAGGITQFYQAWAPLLQAPLSLDDTAAYAGLAALLENVDMPASLKTLCASFAAALFRIFITPIDTFKTTLQVDGAAGMGLSDRIARAASPPLPAPSAPQWPPSSAITRGSSPMTSSTPACPNTTARSPS